MGSDDGTWRVLKRGWETSPAIRQGAVLTALLALVGAAGQAAIPVLIQQMLDRGLVDGRMQGGMLAVLAVIGFGVVVTTAVAGVMTRRRLIRRGEEALAALRVDAFRHIHRLSIATQSEDRRGALVARVTTDVEQLSQFLSWGGVAWLVNTSIIIIVVIVMVVYDARLAFVAIAVVLPMVAVLKAVQHRIAARYDAVRSRLADLLTAVSETVMGASVIRAYGAQPVMRRRAQSTTEALRVSQVRAAQMSAFLFPTGELFSVLTVAAVLGVGLFLGPASGLSAGELVAFVFLVNLFLQPVAEFTDIIDQTQLAVAGWRRVLDVLATPIDLVEPEPGVLLPHEPPQVTVDHVSFRYGSGPMVLDDVTAVLPAGARIALVGATGSGKTTLAKLLARLADPTDGRVLVGDHDVRDVASPSLRSTVVMVPQEGFLFDATIGANVRFGKPGASDAEIHAAFADLGLDDWLAGLAHGLDTPAGERGDSLSVGERQLVSLARAYLADPYCLILDEATSAVDPATEVRLAEAVESLSRGRTTIAIAHRLSTAERADLVLVMEHGRLVEQGRHADLVEAGGPYAKLHERWVSGTASLA
ncbi:MAG: Heterodimeric efflux ABC transporter, permease/ATP-binding subunit 2 [uncultured Acidimicrobiales bacterium]|uniref:Heterodimeric efflux ABC transporter, permease/ATP-binding subunit 2 n=1 Tax=uncultured Acidimicrobiales bacterium TaxID=310071 RepID=A0A6J4HJC0_9ACTN|nr:MAG: Heterodimeric efflux ABC transporter, permease/ATP-binding subunit 2 [uncultured Acidimicrobiales bacterium]